VSRVFLAWELGANLGHLARLLPLCTRLRERGHQVLVAARDLGLATEVLSAAGIRFVQAPGICAAADADAQPVSYADILLMQGWDRPAVLWGLVQAWGNLLRLFRPSVVLLDYAPTAQLTTRVLRVKCAVLGTGFELPPLEDPLPAFPGFDGITAAEAAGAEARALAIANEVLDAYGAPPLGALRDLFRAERRWLTTFAELDHYGPRTGESYVGPVGGLDRGASAAWPEGFPYRVLAYLRPGTPSFVPILRALASVSDAAVICAAPGVSADSVKSLLRPGLQILPRAVRFAPLLDRASVFLSYGPAGSVTEALLRGVPQLIAPAHVEAQMTALRVGRLGAGLMLPAAASEALIGATLGRVLREAQFRVRALEFASRYRSVDPAATADRIVADLESLAVEHAPATEPAGSER
jgi:hypothetical protein